MHALSRRGFLAVSAAAAVASGALGPRRAAAQASLDVTTFGVLPNSEADQTEALQRAIDAAAAKGRVLFLPAGRYRVSGLRLPAGIVLTGLAGRSVLELVGNPPLLEAVDARQVWLFQVGLSGDGAAPALPQSALLEARNTSHLIVEDCEFSDAPGSGVALEGCSGRISRGAFVNMAHAAIISHEATGLQLNGNTIRICGNLGIYVTRETGGHDGTRIVGNRISDVRWDDGGNGQNGNGINVFRADDVIVADNDIADCAFSAVRLNSTRNCRVSGNNCRNSAEVAIFSEFAFSGSIIAQNVVDGAAQGISITNLDSGGHLATCADNVVRNIWPESPNNPDTTPVGIAAEADTVVRGNAVEKVPGVGILAGWGPYLRNVVVADNAITDCRIGIGVSVAEGAGSASVTGNVIEPAHGGHAIAGMEWDKVTVPDLAAGASRFSQISLSGNAISAPD